MAIVDQVTLGEHLDLRDDFFGFNSEKFNEDIQRGLTRKVHATGLSAIQKYFILQLLDKGFSNLFGLEILRHGTNPYSTAKIALNGPNIKLAGRFAGERSSFIKKLGEAAFRQKIGRYFYVYKGGEFDLFKHKEYQSVISSPTIKSAINALAQVVVNPTKQKYLSTLSLLQGSTDEGCYLKKMVSAAAAIITPNLAFKFLPSEIAGRFESDTGGELYKHIAYRTPYAISPWRLGILGNFYAGLNTNIFSRMKSNPKKASWGIFLLALAFVAAKKHYASQKEQASKEL